MAVVLNPMQRDVFGGPAGSTQNAMQQIIEGILRGAEKRKQQQQNELLSSRFAGQTGEQGPPRSPEMFVESLFADPELTPQSKAMGLGYQKAMSDIDLQRAQAEHYRAGEKEKTKEIEYWKPDGSYGSKALVPESKYNETVEKLEGAGYTVQKPKDDSQTGEFERLINKLEKSKKVTPEQASSMIGKRVQKLIESGGENDETNKIRLGDGQKVTLGELREQYKIKYNIPDEFELQMMELNADPMVRQQAKKMKAVAATKPSFVEFMEDARKNGLEGLSPRAGGRTSEPTQSPSLPPGFELDQ